MPRVQYIIAIRPYDDSTTLVSMNHGGETYHYFRPKPSTLQALSSCVHSLVTLGQATIVPTLSGLGWMCQIKKEINHDFPRQPDP